MVEENSDNKTSWETERYVHYHFQKVVTMAKLHSFQSYPIFFFNKNKTWSGQGNQFSSDQYRSYFRCLSEKFGELFPTYVLPLTLPLPLKLWSSSSVGVKEHRCFWCKAAMPAIPPCVSWWSGLHILAGLGFFFCWCWLVYYREAWLLQFSRISSGRASAERQFQFWGGKIYSDLVHYFLPLTGVLPTVGVCESLKNDDN